ncbi:MAG: plastocyanin/azurin family copper-binding protein [Actinomycetota bacterium]
MTTITRISLAALILIAFGVSACGGSSSSSTSSSPAASEADEAMSTTTAPPVAGASKVTLTADPDGQLRYVESTATATAGPIELSLANTSGVPHNVAIKDTEFETQIETSATATANGTLKAGTYTYYCQVPGHEAAGMVGTLTVK